MKVLIKIGITAIALFVGIPVVFGILVMVIDLWKRMIATIGG